MRLKIYETAVMYCVQILTNRKKHAILKRIKYLSISLTAKTAMWIMDIIWP